MVASAILRFFSNRSPLGMATSTLGWLHGIFLSRSTFPQSSSNVLNNRVRLPAERMAAPRVDTCHAQQAHRLSSRPTRIFVQICRRELGTLGTSAPDPLVERIVGLARRDSGRAPARHLAVDPSARKQFRPARPAQRSRWNVSTSNCTTWRVSMKLWVWISRTLPRCVVYGK